MMRAVGVAAVMGNAVMLLASCSAAYPGSGATAEKRRYDITSCENLASHPQPELPPMTVGQCLAMLGYTVKGPDGTIVAPPQLFLPPQPQPGLTDGYGSHYIGPSSSRYMPNGAIDPATVTPPGEAP